MLFTGAAALRVSRAASLAPLVPALKPSPVSGTSFSHRIERMSISYKKNLRRICDGDFKKVAVNVTWGGVECAVNNLKHLLQTQNFTSL